MARGNLKKFALEEGIAFDPKRLLAYGSYQGYLLQIKDAVNQRIYIVTFSVNGGTPEQARALSQLLLTLSQTRNYVTYATFNDNIIAIGVKSRVNGNIENLYEVLNTVTTYCRNNSMVSCCKFCGTQTDLGTYSINGQGVSICSSCFENAQANLSAAQQQIKEKKGNVIGGIVGALLGSLIGVALWVIVYQLGYIAGIVGLVMAVCCIKGYQLLGGKLNLGGVIISIGIAVVMLAFAENIALALEIYNQFKVQYDITFFEAFQAIPEFLKEEEILRAMAGDLAIGYLLMAVASASTIRSIYKESNLKHEMVRLN